MQQIVPLSELRARRHAILNAVRNHKYERTPSGIFMPRVGGGLGIQGFFEVGVNGRDWSVEPNLVVNTGLNHLLSAALAGGSAISSWYIAPFKNDITPSASQTTSNYTSVAGELTEYDESTRQAWTYAAVSSQSITNTASPAVFTINASVTVRGAGIVSVSTKSATSGTLLCYARFGSDRTLADNDELSIKYTITATST